uniref:Aminopeptidase puromycin sensitive n=1 Tax=Homo sapiens TaxID=9606 RepID=A0A7I2V3D7_HUMAN
MWLAAAAPSLARRLLFLGPPPPPLLLLVFSRSSRRRLHSLGLAAMPEKRPFERLPADVSPINYSLCLKPDLLDFTFEGKLEAAAQKYMLQDLTIRMKMKKSPCLSLVLCKQVREP